MSPSGPSLVLIIRHGEKLGDLTSDNDGGPDLSVRGSARAVSLPALFEPASPGWSCTLSSDATHFHGTYSPAQIAGSAPRFPMPTALIATAASKHSNRPVETITPLSLALALSIDDSHADEDYAKVADDVLNHATYTGQVVLICWHHGNIPALATALGASAVPAKWPPTAFDRVWQIPFADGVAGALSDLPQQLLFGDCSA